MTIGERLQEALDAWDGGVMAFVQQMKERLEGSGVRGATYPAVKRYLAGEVQPSIEFLEAAASVLGVRKEWLVAGQGEMSVKKERVRSEAGLFLSAIAQSFEASLRGELKKLTPNLLRSVNHELGFADPDEVPPWSSGLIEVWKRLAEKEMAGERDRAQVIAEALRAPLRAFGVDPVAMRQKGDLTLYVTAMIPALLVAAGEVGHPVPDEDHSQEVESSEWMESSTDDQEV